MKFLYIGQYSEGTTSKMRADTIAEILHDWQFDVIDTHVPFYDTSRLMRSVGFRYKVGCVIKNIKNYIKKNLQDNYDVIWTDKAIFITEKMTILLKKRSKKLIHFTPDPAFTYHKSKYFSRSLQYYDYAITTKSYEQEYYNNFCGNCKIILTTQGFDSNLHKPQYAFEEKINGLLFIGHSEKSREKYLKLLIDNNISVTVAGANWKKFIIKNKENKNIKSIGSGVYGDEYAKTISKYVLSWGAISKWIPEKHTTRTFEIPACGTALITERNNETKTFFNDDEAIFYSSEHEFLEKIKFYLNNPNKLKILSENGYKKTTNAGYDYKSILKKILIQTEII